MTQGQETGNIVVPSQAVRPTVPVISPTWEKRLTGNVSTDYWAQQLSQKLGYNVWANEPYFTSVCVNQLLYAFFE